MTNFEKTRDLKVALDDALEGYGKMLEKAEPSFAPEVSALLSLHLAARDDLEERLRERVAEDTDDGSFMGAVHKTVVTLRSLVDDPDRDWIPGILDGEKRNLGKYDEAIAEAAPDAALLSTLRQHREALQGAVDELGRRDSSQRAAG
jgi:hypothetical protein